MTLTRAAHPGGMRCAILVRGTRRGREIGMTEYQQLAQQMEREGIPVREQEPLSRHTTFHIGGPAALFCQPRTQQELVRALALCREAGVRSYLLGNGSNTLFADEGYDGVVIRLGRGLDQISADPDGVLTAGCGASLSAVCPFCGRAWTCRSRICLWDSGVGRGRGVYECRRLWRRDEGCSAGGGRPR